MPLKPVGCQVIEDTQSAQPHRQSSQSASHAESREESAREEGKPRGRETQLYGGTWGGNGDAATSQSGGQGSCGGRVPLNRSLLMLTRLVWQASKCVCGSA